MARKEVESETEEKILECESFETKFVTNAMLIC
jgi:hypothetical protein